MSDPPAATDPSKLSSRLYSYGRAAPKALVTTSMGSGGARGGVGTVPLPDLPTSPGARRRLDVSNVSPDGGLSGSRTKHPFVGTGSPLPYNKIARSHDRQSQQAFGGGVAVSSEEAEAASTQVVSNGAHIDETRRDPFWFIRILRTELSDHEFAYMNVADSIGTSWDPYNLKIVPFSEVNPNNHYTISAAGVTHCIRRGKEEIAEFTPLDQWEKECGLFREVTATPRPCVQQLRPPCPFECCPCHRSSDTSRGVSS